MPTTTAPAGHWPRPYWQPGTDADARLVYFVFGDFPPDLALALPEGVVARRHRHLDLRSWAGYPLQRERLRGWALAAPALATQARATPDVLRIAGRVADPSSLDYLRTTLRSIARLCNAGAVAVADPLLLTLQAGADWVREVASGNQVTLRQHYAVELADERPADRGRKRVHTRGLAKFGRPDLVLSGVPAALSQQAGAACQQLADMLALGGRLRDGQALPIEGIGELRVSGRQPASASDWDNALLELTWPGA